MGYEFLAYHKKKLTEKRKARFLNKRKK